MWKAECECIQHGAVLRATAEPSSTGASATHRHVDPMQMLTVIPGKQKFLSPLCPFVPLKAAPGVPVLPGSHWLGPGKHKKSELKPRK